MENYEKQVEYWKDAAVRDFETAQTLYKNKRYDACLFFCHLTIEKCLKGLVVKETKEPAPYIHDLPQLAEYADSSLDEETIGHLKTISTFNIGGRYDDYKLSFYKKCTPAYTKEYLKIAERIYHHLEKKYREK